MKVLFLTLRTFSATGGIEKVCCIMGKALYEETILRDGVLQIGSMYDKQEDAFDNPYFPAENFKGFGESKLQFVKQMVQAGSSANVLILSHSNLLLIGWLIKKVSPSTQLILLAHGIEIWQPLSRRKRTMLDGCDTIIAVSNYTRHKIITVQGIPAEKCVVLNNCIDPFLPLPAAKGKNKNLLTRYDFTESDFILFTLTRLSSKERYKGYDKVIEGMSSLQDKYPGIKYLLAGKCDDEEKTLVTRLIEEAGLQEHVILAGYIPNEELQDHFALSDLYIMPSRGEGFGIAFIEAMYYGLPVVAGNTDGSPDALLQGRLGQLVNPEIISEIATAITLVIENKTAAIPNRELLLQHFSYETYKRNLEDLMPHPILKTLMDVV